MQKLFDMAIRKDTCCSIHGDPVADDGGVFHGEKVTEAYLARLCRTLGMSKTDLAEGYRASIDHIVGLGSDFSVVAYRVVEDQDALDATDHSPVYSDVEWL